MIILLSQSINETSTDAVIDWLLFFKQHYQRINGSQNIDIPQNTDAITSVWFRRWNSWKNIENEVQIDSKENLHRLNIDINNEIKG